MRSPILLPLLLVLSGCPVGSAPAPATRPHRVDHVVVCWLKEPGDARAKEQLVTVSKSFVGKIPGLVSVSAGEVYPSTRPAVDSSFDVAIVMTFRDAAALEAYPKSPEHLRAVETTLKPLVARYIVYDFIEESERGHQR